LVVIRARIALARFDQAPGQALFYAAGWKKFEPLWDLVIRAKRLAMMTPLLEGVLSKVTASPGPRTTNEDQEPAI
jgi:hypothetical protein